MTNREIADRLRGMEEFGDWSDVKGLADELDPPVPELGTAVRYRVVGTTKWHNGIVCPDDDDTFAVQGPFLGLESFDSIEYRATRLLAPDEVPVRVPPVNEWPSGAREMNVIYEGFAQAHMHKTLITRATAEEMHGDNPLKEDL